LSNFIQSLAHYVSQIQTRPTYPFETFSSKSLCHKCELSHLFWTFICSTAESMVNGYNLYEN